MVAPPKTRTYGQFCPVAAGLDVIGDRWVLLICRELLHQPRGFNEIKRALPGLASNLLTTRLRSLVAHGLVQTLADGRYELTDEGKDVGPVLRAVARFGVRAIDQQLPEARDPRAVDARRLARGLLLPWTSTRSEQGRVRVVAPDGSAVDLVVAPGEVSMVDPDGEVDVTVHASAVNLLAVRRGEVEFTGRVEGPPDAVARWLRALGLTGLAEKPLRDVV